MKRKVLSITMLLILSLVFTGCGNQSNDSAQNSSDTIKVGALFNQTGDQASLDVPGLNGFQMAADEINANGGVLGKEIEVIAIDGKTDQNVCANGASKMVDVDKVMAICGLADSNYALAAGSIAQKANVLFLTSGATLPELPDQVGDYFFLVPFGDNIQAYAGAEFVASDLSAKTAYMLTDKGMDYTMTLAKFFKERFNEINGADSILLEDSYQTADVDFSAQIERLKGLKVQPDVLYVASDPSKCGVIVKQMRDRGITQPIIGGDGYDTPLLTELGGEGANHDVYFTTHASLENPSEKVQNFVSTYKETYGHEAENAFAALGYDGMYLIADAITRADSADSAAVRDALLVTEGFDGVTGKISYTDGNRVPNKSVTILTVEDGTFKFVKEVLPE
ncbi:MAG: ABC transporter substrate-binding protein [Bacillota bacterium]|nr:ABC transporter substrate-binding protein [Bacillota bacterium]